MHKIKQIPEDFVVKEINKLRLDANGTYSYFLLKKKNYNTLKAIQAISNKLKINPKNIGFAGNKDKKALTEQLISIKNFNKNIKNIDLKDIELNYLGRGNEEIYLGNLKGNDFEITIRNLTNKEINYINKKINHKTIYIPNYFGPQRFSNNNHLIGKSIIKTDFKKAIQLIIDSNSDYNEKIQFHLKKRKNDYVGALKTIPLKLLKLYIHSYQSFLFNKALKQLIKNNNKLEINNQKLIYAKIRNFRDTENPKDFLANENKIISKNTIQKIPIIGFGTELNNKDIDKIIKNIIDKEKINLRDFIIRQIPELSSEGNERDALMEVNDFKLIEKDKDELNKDKEKIIVKFFLPKGCYATVLVDYLLK